MTAHQLSLIENSFMKSQLLHRSSINDSKIGMGSKYAVQRYTAAPQVNDRTLSSIAAEESPKKV